ncbi:hypothetical protein E8M24_31580 [Bacillus thuringiensis]|uniref:YopX family protein n=1 Tax=Bacillus thuringiensis TaxID=1428 RepID=UPI00125F0F36|nr:YopX family protein [Bacillus thuringiensis]KAB5626585.1 hypothetical protein E8M24_31580 [Bacillus thuringiensis]HDR5272581.1 hypothetical protein [Bacillus thuringiensis]
MREIKFRAWDKELKQFSDMALNYKIADINYYTDYEWMQYTGLKDKNGKEICEGDIVRVNKLTFENSGPLPENLVVKFYNGMFQLFRDDEYLYGLHLMYIEDGEVIGNIYENQNLTK